MTDLPDLSDLLRLRQGLRIVHHIPGRIRLRQVRANRAAASLTLHDQGGPAARAAILERLAHCAPAPLPPLTTGHDREAGITPMVTSALGLAALPCSPRPCRRC